MLVWVFCVSCCNLWEIFIGGKIGFFKLWVLGGKLVIEIVVCLAIVFRFFDVCSIFLFLIICIINFIKELVWGFVWFNIFLVINFK